MLDEDTLQQLIGSDQALYLLFMKYTGHFMIVMTLINVVIALVFLVVDPDYSPDDPTPGDGVPPNFDTSLNMIQFDSTDWKVGLVFLNSMITVVFLVLIMLYVYQSKFRSSF